jgi:hypothetical protein
MCLFRSACLQLYVCVCVGVEKGTISPSNFSFFVFEETLLLFKKINKYISLKKGKKDDKNC